MEPWPTVDDVQARLGVPAVSPADTADLESALNAAIGYVQDHSTHYQRSGPSPRVRRGTVDLAVALYQRRGVSQDPFEGITPAMWLSFDKLLGTRRYALPTITGGGTGRAC